MNINKFGGSILKNANDVIKICKIISKSQNSINVFSAFFGITDSLIKVSKLSQSGIKEYESQIEFIEFFHIKICNDLDIKSGFVKDVFEEIKKILNAVFHISDLSNKTLDQIVSFGEILSSKTIYEYLKKDVKCEYLDAQKIIKTDSNFQNASVDFDKVKTTLSNEVKPSKIYVMAGFIGSDSSENPTTIGRNGSDYTAAIIGSVLNSDKITIFKDVDGVFTANPKIVKNAILIDKISYKEMAELSYFGSKALSISAINPAIKNNIPIVIKGVDSKFENGTIISSETNLEMKIKGVSKIDEITLISVNGFNMTGVSGFSARVFSSLSKKSINIVFISQSSSEISICFGVCQKDEILAKNALLEEFGNEISQNLMNIEEKNNQSIIAVSGYGMANTTGIASKVFENLAKGNVNINAISQGLSEMNISFSVNSESSNIAIKLIHASIFENKRINCLIAGKGVVGSSVLNMIEMQKQHFANKGIELNIVGIFDSKKYINYEDKKEENYQTFDEIISKFKQKVDINYVLIDCTSSDLLVENYKKFINSGFNIVTPNKKANTLDLVKLEEIKKSFEVNKRNFFYEANVGAGLPIISTIKDLIDCGDEIVKIEGIFSGTLSYIFNNLSKNIKFSDVVLDAKNKGFTEPNPKDDLSGSDVARKLLILARILGIKANLSDIEIENLSEYSDEKMENILKASNNNNEVLRYIGVIEKGRIYAKLLSISRENPLASTSHTDNIISITTKFYNKTPLVIKGAGAGADVTAIGVVSDIVKLSNLL